MAGSLTEQFNETNAHNLNECTIFRTHGGLTLHLFASAGETCGIYPIPGKDGRELVVGSKCRLRIHFGRIIKDLTIEYYTTQGEKPVSSFSFTSKSDNDTPSVNFRRSTGSASEVLPLTASPVQFTLKELECEFLDLYAPVPAVLHVSCFCWNYA